MERNLIRRMQAILIIVCMCALLFGNPPFSEVNAAQGNTDFANQELSQNIIYINAEIQRAKSDSMYNISATEMKLAGGAIKEPETIAPQTQQGYLRCSFLDGSKNIIKSVNIQNPLAFPVEYVENDKTLKVRENKNTKAELSIRANYDSRMKYVLIDTPDTNQKLTNITMLTINPAALSKVTTPKIAAAGPIGVQKILDNGPDNNKIVFTILGDGYTSTQQTKFIDDATRLMNYLMNEPEYRAYKSNFNFYAIKVVSNVSGAGSSPSRPIDNYFGSCFGIGGVDRLLAPTKTSRVYSSLQTYTPNYDQALLVVNSNKYGGSGGPIATTSVEASSPEILVHEIGHSFVGLSDEYWAGSQFARENINMTRNSNPSTVRWRQFIGVNGVGVYPYEYPGSGWYRPSQNCKMRFLGTNHPFCAVCSDAITKKIRSLINTDSENLVSNPGFESEQHNSQTPTGWSEELKNTDGSYTETNLGARSGNYHLTHWKTSSYEVSTYQTKTGLANGTYTLSAWVKSSGGQTKATMYANGFGGSELAYSLNTASSDWTQVTIPNINVTNGQCKIGFCSKAGAYQYVMMDDVSFVKN